jgi:serine/threonine protein kinase
MKNSWITSGTRLGPYEISSLLGEGGMGQVYQATDTRLGRTVAVKVLPEQLAGDTDTSDRFDREARAVASLSHPNICSLFDIGCEGDTRYLVMEFLAGQTLADRLAGGPLPVAEAVAIGGQIAGALGAAHARGIIHRDLKPANVVLTGNGAKVLDFGLAKFLEGPPVTGSLEDSPTVLATARHTILGTASYMSPDQARGLPLDSRTDAWSLGILIFEMLTGHRPFQGDTVADVLSAVLRDDLDWNLLPAGTPAAVGDLLKQLTARQAGQRLGDLGQAAAVLKAVSPTGATVAVGKPQPDGNSILVLPFANTSPDPENEYFSDGLTEEIIADLSSIKALRVISRTTAMRLKDKAGDIRGVADELGVRYVLEGSVRKAGNNLRITSQLIDTRTDTTMWSDKFGGTLDDVFAIQEQVSRSIVDSLKVTLTADEDRELAAPTVNPYAYDLYLRARRDIWSFQQDRLDRALAELEHALTVVGPDVYLYRGLGLANWQYVNGGMSGDQTYIEKAEQYALKILEMEPDSHHATALLGNIATQRGDIVQWVRQFERAVAASPNDPDYLIWLALGWLWAGHPRHAEPLLTRLMSIDPLFDLLQFAIGGKAYLAGCFEEALSYFDKCAHLTPGHPGWVFINAQALASAGRNDEAVAIIERDCLAPDEHPLARLTHILRCALLGDGAAADELTTPEFEKVIWGDLQYTQMMAQTQALLSRPDAAMKWLTRAVSRGFIHYPFLSEIDPLLANVRQDPRFAELMADVKRQWEGFEGAVGK